MCNDLRYNRVDQICTILRILAGLSMAQSSNEGQLATQAGPIGPTGTCAANGGALFAAIVILLELCAQTAHTLKNEKISLSAPWAGSARGAKKKKLWLTTQHKQRRRRLADLFRVTDCAGLYYVVQDCTIEE